MRDLPVHLTATAVVKTEHPSGLSIATAIASDTLPLKTLLPKPQVVRDAVKALKDAGFDVLTVDRFSISILGSTVLFQTAFAQGASPLTLVLELLDGPASPDRKLIMVDGPKKLGYIPTVGTTFASVLDRVVIDQPDMVARNKDFAHTEAPSDTQKDQERRAGRVLLEDLGDLLNKRDQEITGTGVLVTVLDSGFNGKGHAHFDPAEPRIQLMGAVDNPITERIQQERAAAEANRGIALSPMEIDLEYDEELNQVVRPLSNGEVADFNNCKREFVRLALASDEFLQDAGVTLEQFNEARRFVFSTTITTGPDSENWTQARGVLGLYGEFFLWLDQKYDTWRDSLLMDDPNGHGTAMVANLLAVAPQANIHVLKHCALDSITSGAQIDLGKVILREAIDDRDIEILSCSFARDVAKTDIEGFLDPLSNKPLHAYALMLRNRVAANQYKLILFAAGNLDNAHPEYVGLEAWTLSGDFNVIIVGGAYRMPSSPVAVASDVAHGYVEGGRKIPDVCGFCGPKDDSRRIWNPTSANAQPETGRAYWELGQGTSHATAQVAGVAALVKQQWAALDADPNAPGLDARSIKDIIVASAMGITGGGVSAQGTRFGTGPNEVDAGYVDIDNALRLTRLCRVMHNYFHREVQWVLEQLRGWESPPVPIPTDFPMTIDRGRIAFDYPAARLELKRLVEEEATA